MSRPLIDEYYLRMASLVATRSTCARRAVGCVLVNERYQVLATGYNGVARGRPHCNKIAVVVERDDVTGHDYVVNTLPNACPGARAVSGTALDACDAIHAEQNALLQCRDAWAIWTAYVTVAPCLTCLKLLLNTSCRRLVARAIYHEHGRVTKLWCSNEFHRTLTILPTELLV